MKKMISSKTLLAVLFFAMACTFFMVTANAEEPARAPAAAVTAAAPKTTLDNLLAAFNGESNANARYLAFAQKADEEGYGAVASLFRAAARAEQVHFEHHAKVITKLGGTPKAAIEPPVVKTTKENLEAAFNGETYEKTTMYPEFLAQAKKEGVKIAARSFRMAMAAEAVHAKLYDAALKNLDAMKGPKKDLYVCPECGNVMETPAPRKCPICNTKSKKYITVN